MSSHNLYFCGEVRKYQHFILYILFYFEKKIALSRAVFKITKKNNNKQTKTSMVGSKSFQIFWVNKAYLS